MQRGYTLIEVVIAVAILAILVAAGASFAFGSKPFAMRSAVTQFKAQVQAAEALAAISGNGATIIVQTRPGAAGSAVLPGFKSIVYAGRPSTGATLVSSNIAPLVSEAAISESAIGAAPFAIFISSSGHVSVQPAYPAVANFDSNHPGALASEPQTCPASDQYVLQFSASGTTDQIVLPCAIALTGTPEPIITATSAETPTPTPAIAPTP